MNKTSFYKDFENRTFFFVANSRQLDLFWLIDKAHSVACYGYTVIPKEQTNPSQARTTIWLTTKGRLRYPLIRRAGP